jgi:hypothetical protein
MPRPLHPREEGSDSRRACRKGNHGTLARIRGWQHRNQDGRNACTTSVPNPPTFTPRPPSMGWRDMFRRDKVQPVSEDRSADLDEPTASPRDRLVRVLMEYGLTNREQDIDGLKQVYADCIGQVTEQERAELVMAFAELAEARKLSVNPLFAFLFQDPSPLVVSCAVLNLAPMWVGSDSADALLSTRELCTFAERLIAKGDERRAGAIYAGLLLLGDRRVIEHMGPCWRNLSSVGRLGLLQLRGMAVYATTVDWLIDWLEDCEGQEFGSLAGLLARMAIQAREEGLGVQEVRRALPVWCEPPEPPLQTMHTWSFEEFGARIAERLRRIAAHESNDRVMPEVLAEWGIPLDGIASPEEIAKSRSRLAEARSKKPTMPEEAFQRTMRFPGVPVPPGEVLMRNPQVILGWGLFNPYGPTLNLVGRSFGEETDLLWYVMLNPFEQRWVVLGSLVGSDRREPGALFSQLQELFAENAVELATGESLPLVTFPPSFVVNHGETNPTPDEAWALVRQSDGVRSRDLYELMACQERGEGNPWHRATELREGRTFARTGSAGARADDAEVEAWIEATLSQQQFLNELIAFHEAWAGSIGNVRNHGSPEMADRALSREALAQIAHDLGVPYFKVIAERLGDG